MWVILPRRKLMKTKDVVIIAACTFLIILGGYISVPIGPVPFVLTNFFVMLIGLMFGWKKAVIATFIYLLLGAIGLPVYANGSGGVAHLFGLTGGFLISFLLLAFISGFGFQKNIVVQLLLLIAGSLTVHLIGVPWAIMIKSSSETPWTISIALKYCTIPFIVPNIIKVTAALLISFTLKKPLNSILSSDND